MNKIEYKSINDNGDVMISGYASVFGIVDSYDDIVEQKAFARAIEAGPNNVKFLWQHDARSPIGKVEKIFSDDYGLYIEAKITSGTKRGREAIDLVHKGIVDGLSIGYNTVSSWQDNEDRRVISDLDLWEVSLVTFPANSKARLDNADSIKLQAIITNQKTNNKEEKNMNNFLEISVDDSIQTKDGFANFVKGISSPDEYKTISTDQQDRGGYAVVAERFKGILQKIAEISPMRKLASVDTISSNALELLIQEGEFECGWVSERAARADTLASKLLQKRIMIHEVYAQPKATQKLLDDSFVNIEEWITSQLVQSFAAKENEAFIHGDGENKPKGILSYDEIERVGVRESGLIAIEDLLNLLNSLPERYQPNATFLMNRRVYAALQMIRDANGRFIIQPSLSEKAPSTLFGIPVVLESNMPFCEAGKSVVAIADFKQAYKIVDRHGIMIMKDPYTEKPFTKFYATKRLGGEVVNHDAIKLLKA
ncbi:MAG: phage major capsid protein [Rickettsiaceae bacterium]|nr:phage major capsid protein [Rickettsiaceae bacterium]